MTELRRTWVVGLVNVALCVAGLVGIVTGSAATFPLVVFGFIGQLSYCWRMGYLRWHH